VGERFHGVLDTITGAGGREIGRGAGRCGVA
jgi:hypothetical protein